MAATDFKFPHPEPYKIQQKLMEAIYDTCEQGGVGIFESPTGTGKSLSIICAVMKWLEDKKKKDDAPPVSTGDWVGDHSAKQAYEDRMAQRARTEERLALTRKRQREGGETSDASPRKMQKTMDMGVDADADEEFLIPDFIPDAMVTGGAGAPMELDSSTSTEGPENEDLEERKIFYCSRTHSQLAQFVKEVKSTIYGGVPRKNESTGTSVSARRAPASENSRPPARVISLASRKQLCINSSVAALRDATRITDACLDKLKAKTKRGSRVPGAPKQTKAATPCEFHNQENFEALSDSFLSKIHNIEDMVKEGKAAHTCPYFASHKSIKAAEIVALPYQILLSEETRASLGISLRGNIVVVDEAHNLINAVNETHSVVVTKQMVDTALSQLRLYLDRYKDRLRRNLKTLKNIETMLEALSHAIGLPPAGGGEKQICTLNEFANNGRLDNFNATAFNQFAKQTDICNKLKGFAAKILNEEGTEDALNEFRHASPLQRILNFFVGLMNNDRDGRVVHQYNRGRESQSSVRLMMLNPAVYFQSVLNEAHAVILAGGTMQPEEDVKSQLFSAIGERKYDFQSYDHVVPIKNILALSLDKTMRGRTLNFQYDNRSDVSLIEDLGRIIKDVCMRVPDGVVVFFGSYGYEEEVFRVWEATSAERPVSILDEIRRIKTVFREPRNHESDAATTETMDSVLAAYSTCVRSTLSRGPESNGALLSCVVGGKMSEGIDFKDELGRCVIMVGLPYPNQTDPELVAKRAFHAASGRNASDYVTNMAMKAINQSIGRSIRHIADYATIVLLDQRYQQPMFRSRLPDWISRQLKVIDKYGPFLTSLRDFFETHKPDQQQRYAERAARLGAVRTPA